MAFIATITLLVHVTVRFFLFYVLLLFLSSRCRFCAVSFGLFCRCRGSTERIAILVSMEAGQASGRGVDVAPEEERRKGEGTLGFPVLA